MRSSKLAYVACRVLYLCLHDHQNKGWHCDHSMFMSVCQGGWAEQDYQVEPTVRMAGGA